MVIDNGIPSRQKVTNPRQLGVEFHPPNLFFPIFQVTQFVGKNVYDFYRKTQTKNIITPVSFWVVKPPSLFRRSFPGLRQIPRNSVVDEGNATLGNIHRPWKLMLRCAHPMGGGFLDPQSDLGKRSVIEASWSWVCLEHSHDLQLLKVGGPSKQGLYKTRVIWVPLWKLA